MKGPPHAVDYRHGEVIAPFSSRGVPLEGRSGAQVCQRDGDVEVETLEPQSIRGVWCHAGWYRVAQRYAQSILEETPVHKSRGTVVVGAPSW